MDAVATLVSGFLADCCVRALLWVAATAWLCFPTLCSAVLVSAQGDYTESCRRDRFFIQPKPGSETSLTGLHRTLGTAVLREFKASGGLILLSVPSNETVTNLLARYRASGLVQFAEPDSIIHAACAPHDPMFTSQWAFWNYGQSAGRPDADIDAVEAWSLRTAATNVIVAVVDSGVRATHEDLASNLWRNPSDGSFGTNALTGTNEPWDDYGHGTQIAGIIGAVGNNGIGVTGIAWRAQIMACKALDNFGFGAVSDTIACIEFARANGARIINLSLGASETGSSSAETNFVYVQALSNALAAARANDVVVVAAAGNRVAGEPVLDIDVTPFYPASLPLDNIVSVAASTSADFLWGDSNFGATNVDLAAPGVGLVTTGHESDSTYLSGIRAPSGTSHATAMVSGALLLVRSQYPTDSYLQAIERILKNVDRVPALAEKTLSGGRLNLRKSLGVSGGIRPAVAVRFKVTNDDTNVLIQVTGSPCAGYVLEASTNLTDWEGVTTNLTSKAGELQFTPDYDPEGFRFFRAYAEP